MTFKKVRGKQVLLSVDESLFSIDLQHMSLTKVLQLEEEFDPIISINKITYDGKILILLNTLRCKVITIES